MHPQKCTVDARYNLEVAKLLWARAKLSQTNPDGSRAFGDLKSALNDVESLHESWQKQKGKLFAEKSGKLLAHGTSTCMVIPR